MTRARLRAAVPDDSEALAALHVTAWCESYRGLLPDAALDTMSAADRTVQWLRALERRSDLRVLVAETAEGAVGFASGGPRRGDELSAEVEVYALYVLRQWQRQGIGARLLGGMARLLAAPAPCRLGLWVLRDNAPARAFYARQGGRADTERTTQNHGAPLAEVAYVWDEIAMLIAPEDASATARRP